MTLLEHLTVVKETRSDINQKHDLVDVMFLVMSAILSGADCWQGIEKYGYRKLPWLWVVPPKNNNSQK